MYVSSGHILAITAANKTTDRTLEFFISFFFVLSAGSPLGLCFFSIFLYTCVVVFFEFSFCFSFLIRHFVLLPNTPECKNVGMHVCDIVFLCDCVGL